jgi:hypothetical protein
MPPFTDTLELKTDDLVDYLRVAQRTLNGVGMGGGVVGVLYGVYLASIGEVALSGVLVVMGIVLFLASATRFMDRLRASSIGKKIVGTKATFVVGDNGIDSTTIAGKTHIAWSSSDNVAESDRVIVLRRGRVTVVWLPKRAMGTDAEREAQLEFIRGHFGAAGSLGAASPR